MTRDQVLAELKKQLFEALETFGKHIYYDKGVEELIHIPLCAHLVQGLEGIQDQAWVLSQLGKEVHGMVFANSLFYYIDQRTEDNELQTALMKYPNGIEVGEY